MISLWEKIWLMLWFGYTRSIKMLGLKPQTSGFSKICLVQTIQDWIMTRNHDANWNWASSGQFKPAENACDQPHCWSETSPNPALESENITSSPHFAPKSWDVHLGKYLLYIYICIELYIYIYYTHIYISTYWQPQHIAIKAVKCWSNKN